MIFEHIRVQVKGVLVDRCMLQSKAGYFVHLNVIWCRMLDRKGDFSGQANWGHINRRGELN